MWAPRLWATTRLTLQCWRYLLLLLGLLALAVTIPWRGALLASLQLLRVQCVCLTQLENSEVLGMLPVATKDTRLLRWSTLRWDPPSQQTPMPAQHSPSALPAERSLAKLHELEVRQQELDLADLKLPQRLAKALPGMVLR